MALMDTTRRAFFQRLAAASCAVLPAGKRFPRTTPTFYEGRVDCIEVVRIESGRKRKIQVVPSTHPSGFAIDPFRHRLFVTNDIDEYEALPTGSIESYAIDPATGRIELRDRRALSLSATGPRHLDISPDGRHLVVAAYRGGAFNVLPVQADGKIGDVTQVLKEIGSGPDPALQATAHPHSVVFHPSGKLVVATDLGADRISLFSFESGRLSRLQQIETPPGSGPANLHISLSGEHVFVEQSCALFDAAIDSPQLTPLLVLLNVKRRRQCVAFE
jgi:6-phosphogluconolactonase